MPRLILSAQIFAAMRGYTITASRILLPLLDRGSWQCRARLRYGGKSEFLTCLAHDLPSAPDAKSCHDRRHDKVGPCRARPKHAGSRRDHRDVADRIIARAYPYRAHVRVTAAEAIEHHRDGGIGNKRGNTDHAHQMRFRRRAVPDRPDSASQNPKAEQGECRSLEQRGACRGHRVEGTPDNAKREHFKNRMMAVTAGGR